MVNKGLRRQGILTSYLVGAPVGLLTIFIVSALPGALTGEGLATIAMFGVYGKAILGLIVSFIIALGIAGHYAEVGLENGKHLLKVSFIYSLTVNLIIWSVFMILTVIQNYEEERLGLYFILPVLCFLFCNVITPFTLGLFICYL